MMAFPQKFFHKLSIVYVIEMKIKLIHFNLLAIEGAAPSEGPAPT
jgi:hypothetical protein